MIELKRLKLINWHNFENVTFDCARLTYMIGVNAVGKTTILDAIRYCLTTNRNFNALGNKKSGRTLQGSVHAKQRGEKFCLRGVTDDRKALLESLYPGKFTFTAYRDSYDYIYTVEELTELHGKKLQAKRNHCNRFEQDHPDARTEVITPENLALCREMVQKWYEVHEWNEQIEQEKTAISRAFDHFEAAHMDGLMLIENGEVIAFSMGARMNEQYYDVCFEKAYSAINGAYAMINREFSRMIAEKYPALAYLNREDDMGEPGLRKAKESYQPTLLLAKYNATLREEE